MTAAAAGVTTDLTTTGTGVGPGIAIVQGTALVPAANDKGNKVAAAINALTAQTGVTATANAGAVSLVSNGRDIAVTGNVQADTGITTALTTTAATTANSLTNRSSVTLSTTQTAGINVSGNTAGALTAAGLSEGSATVSTTAGAGVSSLDLTTAAGSQAALTTLDSAINTITDSRAAMGAYQNRLTASISNLQTTSMNLSASRSRILDTDYAKETTNLAKAQIISQAATAMLAQANQSGQSVLALLK
jgi:flagellin